MQQPSGTGTENLKDLPKRQPFIKAKDEEDIIDIIGIWKKRIWTNIWSKEDSTYMTNRFRAMHAIVLLDQLNKCLDLGGLEIKTADYWLYANDAIPRISFNMKDMSLRKLIHEFLHHYYHRTQPDSKTRTELRIHEREANQEALRIVKLTAHIQ